MDLEQLAADVISTATVEVETAISAPTRIAVGGESSALSRAVLTFLQPKVTLRLGDTAILVQAPYGTPSSAARKRLWGRALVGVGVVGVGVLALAIYSRR